MKTLNFVALTALSVSLIFACDVSQAIEGLQQEEVSEITEQEKVAGRWFNRHYRTVPFKANFFTVLNEEEVVANPDACDTPPFTAYNVQDGSGEATHLGRFTTHITFCGDITELLPGDDSPGVLEPGESLPYDSGVGSFIASNGDKLYFTASGEVLPSDHPDYDFEFHDVFIFTGGTGRFAGAKGRGMMDSFVDLATDRTDHRWTGTLKLPK
ncbi:hypothetical protein NC796_06640 [Aliifodinibius sp. S!AR15-10]|uniref:hypothetical protein n=1 Tax=Aliifodinibius sp. S!AR15-10 TaxID=2950437 RepID=UPI0028567188|nr:hypothetical protein [Aliifodinibius sp. S!AR15-10]MDR8390806.1 hypothetical protein [Aliifodinibius sp. S!AR15-10]